jgi:hypothetical protein
MDLFRSLQLIALKDVACTPTPDFRWRQICRYYSKTFNTPLDKVIYELDPYDVAQAYYEDIYEDMELNERLEVILQAIKSDDQIKEDELKQSEDSLATDRFAKGTEIEAVAAQKRREQNIKKQAEEKQRRGVREKEAADNLLKELGVFEEVMKKPITKRKAVKDIDAFSLSFTGLEEDLDLAGP